MTPIKASRMRRASLVVAVFVGGVTGIWLAIDRQTSGNVAAKTAPPPPIELPSESRAGMGGVVDGPPTERVRAELEHSNMTAATDPLSAQAASATPRGVSGGIRGRVLETSGEPIPDLSVWLVPTESNARARYLAPSEQPNREVTTNVHGEFMFVDVAYGVWLVGPAPPRTVTPTPDDHGIAPMAILVDMRIGEGTRDIEIRAQRGLMIRGRVLRPDGSPAFNGVVGARSQDAPGRCLAPTRSDGSFTLGPLVSSQYELLANSEYEGTTSAVVLAFAGDDGVVLQLREGGSLFGRVIDARAHREGNVVVVAMRQDVEPHEILSASTEADGLFHFNNVAPGSYQVLAHTENAWFAIRSGVDVAGGRATEDLLLELREGGWLRLQSTSSDTVRVEIRQDDVRVSSSHLSELDTSLAVPAGRITVRWTIGSRPTGEQSIEIVPGAERKIVLPD